MNVHPSLDTSGVVHGARYMPCKLGSLDLSERVIESDVGHSGAGTWVEGPPNEAGDPK